MIFGISYIENIVNMSSSYFEKVFSGQKTRFTFVVPKSDQHLVKQEYECFHKIHQASLLPSLLGNISTILHINLESIRVQIFDLLEF